MARQSLKIALVQMCSTTSIERNTEIASAFIREAAEKGAELIVLPEVANLMQVRRKSALEEIRVEAEDPMLRALCDLAKELDVWIHAGSLAIQLPEEDRFANRGFLIDNTGEIRRRYDKIHMFDVDLADGESYRESNGFRPGGEAVLAKTPWGQYGMTICYDVRFPHLYRRLAKAGAGILAVPAAFTRTTGKAHWHTLLRARAIENGCFVVAAAQCGDHEDGRKTYGHSLVIDPWGDILADGGEEPGIVVAEPDLSRVEEARKMVPSLGNDRDFAFSGA